MHQNPSSAVQAMKVTLNAIQQVQRLLDSERRNLDPYVYEQVKACLHSAETRLVEDMNKYQFSQSEQAPNLNRDAKRANKKGLFGF